MEFLVEPGKYPFVEFVHQIHRIVIYKLQVLVDQCFQSKAPKTHRPTKSTVSDLASIEEQFRNLLKEDNSLSVTPHKSDGSNEKNEYVENEMIRMRAKIDELSKYKAQAQKLKADNKVLSAQLANNAKQGGFDQFYQERANKLSHKVSV